MAGAPAKPTVATQAKKTIDQIDKAVKTTFKVLAGLAITSAVAVGVVKNVPDTSAAQAVLTDLGYSDVKTSYAGVFSGKASCDTTPGFAADQFFMQDNFPTAFTAKKDGQKVEGLVCFNYTATLAPFKQSEQAVVRVAPAAQQIEAPAKDFTVWRPQYGNKK